MKIWIDISLELVKKTGVGAYILTLIRAFEYMTVKTDLYECKIPKIIKLKYLILMIWQNTILYLKVLWKQPDLMIFPNFLMPYFKREKTKYAVVIHDLCPFKDKDITNYVKFIYTMATRIALKKADILITVSETIKQEIIDLFKVDPGHIKVLYNSVGKHFVNAGMHHEILNKYSIQKNKYILSVATLNKRKNIPALIKAFESISERYPGLKLVLVGGMGNENREKLTKHPNIVFAGYIPDYDLPTLYANALIYVFPSLYEGFGTPIIEAQYSKCPLLCSDIPVFREVAGNGAEFCETDFNSIAEKIEYLINNKDYRNKLTQLGYENVKRFSIEEISTQLIEIIGDKDEKITM